ncbi:MAG: cysteine desulfurase family protein [Bacillota bacterium]|nr:cysteine desulfurase family protein [Bacillota bacterium]
MSEEVYLDHAATSPVRPEAAEVVRRLMEEEWGNPSSVHRKGLEARRAVEEARQQLAAVLAAEPREITFTSGATEADNLALLGGAAARRGWGRKILVSAVEHEAILQPAARLEREGWEVERLPVDREGRLRLDRLEAALDERVAVVAVMLVNNELGTVEPVDQVGALLARRFGHLAPARRPLFHVDAVQGLGKIRLRPRAWGVGSMALSAHKVGGPKGVGAIWLAKELRVEPLLLGGGQERGLRSGTENTAGIAAFGRAAELAEAERAEAVGRLAAWRERLIRGLEELGGRLNGPRPASDGERLAGAAPHIVNVGFPGLRGETLLHALEAEGVYVSTGSACTASRPEPSHVLLAAGLEPALAQGAVRLSLSPWATRAEEIDATLAAFGRALAMLRGAVGEVRR